ncbi:hypothetical protein HNQ02_003264 [Flavobacterium sp. 7E]|uniref:hypothetical protein n=1 Tax=Flavobacterium sp. 7E TaxID=2735898 RepID=UPI0015704AC7|nr:hypothetical protein [Flavobacterium sp. 7E]NRS90324.1 hypothetical protein [Flavobacterium sp. 7E]
MFHKNKYSALNSFTAILFVLIGLVINAQNPAPTYKEIVHDIAIIHEGLSFTEKQKSKLIELQDANDLAFQYYMDVESVICLDHKCKIVQVRLFWDKLGFYNHYEMAKGIVLEKTDGISFTEADYKKLDNILGDRDSSLKEYYQNQRHLAAHGSEGLIELDGATGATSGIDENSIVKGAAWTSCTLWHWANGAIFEVIRKQTAKELTTEALVNSLHMEDEKYRRFVIKELMNRKAYEAKTLAVVLQEIGNIPSLSRLLIDYLENAASDIYFDAIKKLYVSSDKSFRVIFLSSMLNFIKPDSGVYFEWATKQLAGVNSFPELQLLFRMLEKQIPLSDKSIDETVKLLTHSEFLIARASYYFLQNKAVNANQKLELDAFQKKNGERL